MSDFNPDKFLEETGGFNPDKFLAETQPLAAAPVKPAPKMGGREAALHGAVEATPFGQKLTAAGAAGVLNLFRKASEYGVGPKYWQNIKDTSYQQELAGERGRFAKAETDYPAEHWYSLTPTRLGQMGGSALSMSLMSPFKAAEGAGWVGRTIPAAFNTGLYGAAHGFGRGDTLGESFGNAATEGTLATLLGGAGHAAFGELLPYGLSSFNRFNQSIVNQTGLPTVIPGDFAARMAAPTAETVAEAAGVQPAQAAAAPAIEMLGPAANTDKSTASLILSLLNRGRKGDFQGMGQEAENIVLKNGPKIQAAAKNLGLDIGDSKPADWVHRDFDITKQMSTKLRNSGLDGVAEEAIVRDPRYATVRSGAEKVKLVEDLQDEAGKKIGEFVSRFDALANRGQRFNPQVAADRIQREVLEPLEKYGTSLDEPAANAVKNQIEALRAGGKEGLSFDTAFGRIRQLDKHLRWDNNSNVPAPVRDALRQVRGIMKDETEKSVEDVAISNNDLGLFDQWKQLKRDYGALTKFSDFAAERLQDARGSNRALSLTDYLAGGAVGTAVSAAHHAVTGDIGALPGLVASAGGAVANKWARERGPQMMALSLLKNGAANAGPAAAKQVMTPFAQAASVGLGRYGQTSGATLADLLRAQQATPASRTLRDLMNAPGER